MTTNYESMYWSPEPLNLPTPEQCSSNAQVPLSEPHRPDHRGYACWYPQMGGYTGRCVVVLEDPQSGADHACFEAIVWHDGQFPFEDEDRWGDHLPPAHLHHCNAQQFINFGELVKRLAER